MATPAESSSLSPKARAAMQACRARTGFDSYNAYLHFHNVTTWALDAICGPLRPLTEPRVEPLDTNRELRQEDSFVLNVSKDWELSVDPHCDESGTDIIEAISHRPENARLQIILWNIQRTDLSRSRESLVDFIGLRFGLDPHIFRALGAFPRPWDFYGILDRYKRTYVKIGSHIATVCHSKDDNNEKPVMLIAGIPNYRLGDQLDPCPPFDHSSSSDKQLDSMRITGYYSFYLQALNSFLERYKTHQADPNDLLLLGLLPLLQVFLLGTRVECAYLQAELNVSGTPDYTTPNRKQPILDRNRANVRRCIVDMEDGWSSVVTYTRLRFGWNASRRAISQDFEEDEMKPIADEAKRWESAGRDHLQLEVSKASLEESKKSIEVSNQQIAEGKRVKTFTILAFVYVPLNLATSIYGMNLQQLNGSGQTVKHFVVTALVALIITGGTWYVAEVLNVYRTWYRRRREDGSLRRKGQPFPVPRYSLAERILMITWLLRDHHGPWMWRTGAFSKVLFNSEKPMSSHYSTVERMSAGGLVSAYTLGQLEPWDIEDYNPHSEKSDSAPETQETPVVQSDADGNV